MGVWEFLELLTSKTISVGSRYVDPNPTSKTDLRRRELPTAVAAKDGVDTKQVAPEHQRRKDKQESGVRDKSRQKTKAANIFTDSSSQSLDTKQVAT